MGTANSKRSPDSLLTEALHTLATPGTYNHRNSAHLTSPSTMSSTLTPSFLAALKTWAPQTLPFTALPPEIRNQIYDLATDSFYWLWLNRLTETPPYTFIAPLAATNKQIQQEALSLMFGTRQCYLYYEPECAVPKCPSTQCAHPKVALRRPTRGFLDRAGRACVAHVKRLEVCALVRGEQQVWASWNVRVGEGGVGVDVKYLSVAGKEGPREVAERVRGEMREVLGEMVGAGGSGGLGLEELEAVRVVLARHCIRIPEAL